jgi:hypothetical protein
MFFGLRARTVKSPAVGALVRPTRPEIRAVTVVAAAETERWRLDNLGPAPGSRKKKNRKGRGHAAGQVCSSHPRPQLRPQLLLLPTRSVNGFLTCGSCWQ